MIKKIFIKHNNYGITTLHKTPFCGIMAPLGMQIISQFLCLNFFLLHARIGKKYRIGWMMKIPNNKEGFNCMDILMIVGSNQSTFVPYLLATVVWMPSVSAAHKSLVNTISCHACKAPAVL